MKIFVLIALLFYCSSVLALGVADGSFELDGDARSSSRDDWDKSYQGTGSDVLHLFATDVEGANFFTGNTGVDSAPISAWRWGNGTTDPVAANLNLISSSTVVYNNVNQLTDFLTIYFSATVATAGPGTLAFWYFQSDVVTSADGRFTGAHQDGDLLVLVSLNSASTVNAIQVFRWSSFDTTLVLVYTKTGNDAQCRRSFDQQSACGISNAVAINSYKNGDPQFAVGTFIEGGIKLNDIFPVEIPCYSSYLVSSKVNISSTMSGLDFIVGDFPFCGIAATLTCDQVGISALRDGFVYEGTITVRNPFARIIKNVEVKFGNTTIAVIPAVLPKDNIPVEFTGTSKSAPGTVGPGSVGGQVGGKYPYIVFTDVGTCPSFIANPSLNLTKSCEVQLAPYKFADDGTKEIKIFIQGTVTNNGNVDLTNVVVSDDDGFTWEYPYIRVGESIFFSRSIKATDALTPSYTDTVTATGVAILGLGIAIAQPVTATCPTVDITPGLTLTKKCTTVLVPDGDYEVVRVNYEITVKNTGNIELRNVIIVDDKGTAALSDDIPYGPLTLLVNESQTFIDHYTPSDPTAPTQRDTVTASAITIVHLYPAVTATPATAICEGIKPKPSLALTKNCTAALITTGDAKAVQVTFTATVTNTGDTTLLNVIVTDDRGTISPADDFVFGPYRLFSGETRTITQSYAPTNPTAISFTDTVTATAEPNIRGFAKVSATPATATCAGVLVNKKLELTKACVVETTSDAAGYLTVVVNVEGTVKNAGDIDLTGVKVFDSDGYSWDIGNLAPNQVKTFSRQYTPSSPTDVSYSDTVTATGTAVAGFGSISAAPITATCSRPPVNPNLKLEKTCYVSLSNPTATGERTVTVNFEITVTNTGNVALKDVIVSDDKGTAGVISDDQTFGPVDLAPGAIRSFTGFYPAQNPLSASYQDTATATAKNIYKGFPTVTATPATATCNNVNISPKLELNKTCETSLQDTTNGGKQVVVRYVITVVNSGNVALKNVYVVDDPGTPGNPVDDVKYGPFNINAFSSTVVTGEYVPVNVAAATQSDTASAYGENTIVGYPLVTAQPYKAICEGIKVHPRLELTKECESVLVDDTDGYYKVIVKVRGTASNTGDIALNDVTVVDAQDNYVWNLGTLNPGQTVTFSQNFNPSVVTASIYTDTVVGSASLPAGLGTILSETARAECRGIQTAPALSLTKQCIVMSVDSPSNPGRKEIRVGYSGTVTNSGTHLLKNVYVVDDKGTTSTADDDKFGPYNLAPFQTETFNGIYPPGGVTQSSFTDSVYAYADSGIRGFAGTTTFPVTATCQNIPNNPKLQLTKQCVVALEQYGPAGEKTLIVKYSGEVKNTGDVPLVNVVVVDDLGTPSTADDQSYGPFSLGVGQSQPYNGVYVPSNPLLPNYTDSVKASADNLYVGFPGASARTTATCLTVVVKPKLTVTKQCMVEVVPYGTVSRVQETITGTVRNDGDIEIYNVVVHDSDGYNWTFARLSVGESQSFTRLNFPTDPTLPLYVDTVYATGRVPAGLGTVTSTSVTAQCKGVEIKPALQLTKECVVKTDAVTGGLQKVKVVFSGNVTNTGNVKLVNVYVTDDLGTSSTSDDRVFGPFTLNPGETTPFSSEFYPDNSTAAYYHDTVTAKGDNSVYGFPGAAAAPVSAKCQGIQSHPALNLTKACEVSLLITPTKGKKVNVFYFGEVTNTGDTELRNIYITDDKGTPSDTSDDQTFGPFNLLPGKSVSYSSSYFPADPTQEFYSDTVRASGDSVLIGFPGATATPVTARCAGVKVKPKLVLTKRCEANLVPETSGTLSVRVHVTGSATNAGDIELLNVVVTDNDGYKWEFAEIKVNETKALRRIVIPDEPTAASFYDTITATADLPAGLGTTASAPVSATCKGIITNPRLTLQKECRTTTEAVSATSPLQRVIVYYSGNVTNTGNVTLWDVYVRDDKGTADIAADDVTYGPFLLKAGESAPFQGFYYPAAVTSPQQRDTVTAWGRNIINDFPAADAVPVTATCIGVKSAPSLALTKACETALESQFDGSKKVIVTYSGTVENTGDTTLVDVYVTDDKGTPFLPNDDQTFGPFILPVGSQQTFSGFYYPVIPTQANYSDTVRAIAKNSIVGFPGATATPVTAVCAGVQVHPKLDLTKECSTALVPRSDGFLDVQVVVHGSVANNGDIELLGVVIRDDIDGFIWTIDRLAVGETKAINRQYYPQYPTADFFNDTITATATLPAGLGATAATPVTARCKGIKSNPAITLTKTCSVVTEDIVGNRKEVRVQYQGTATNSGNYDLVGVVIIDDVGTTNDNSDDRQYGPYDIKVGASVEFKGFYIPRSPTDAYFADTVTATGASIINGFPGATATPVTAECAGIHTNPSLVLEKSCLVTSEAAGNYKKVVVTYRGRVTNNGNVSLVNVIVQEYASGGSATFGPFSLAPLQSASFIGSYYPLEPTSAYQNDTVFASADNIIVGFPGATASPVSASCAGISPKPKLTLTKECSSAFFGTGLSRQVRVNYIGNVTNAGDTTVVDIYVTDDKGTSITADDETFGPYSLAPGAYQTFSGYYFTDTPAAESFSDTVTAYGNNVYLGFPVVSAPATTATCRGIVTNPTLVATKECTSIVVDDPLQSNSQRVQVVITGTVVNLGDIELNDVKIVDSDGYVWTIGYLAIGQIAYFDRKIFSSTPTALSYNDTIVASGKAILGFGTATSAPVTAKCKGVIRTPKLDVVKRCVTSLEAFGANQRVLVSYDGTVTNTGDVKLINVVVVDDLGTPSKTSDDKTYGPFTLGIGEVGYFHGSYYPADPTAVTQSDTVRATGDSIIQGFPRATDVETAVCAGIVVSPSLYLTKECMTRLVDDTANIGRKRVDITYKGTVVNNGNVTLVNVVVTDDKGTPGVTSDDQTFGPFTLAPRQSRDFYGSYAPLNPTAATFNDTVTASGNNIIIGFPGAKAAPVTATCNGPSITPSLILKKQCNVRFSGSGTSKTVVVGYDITVTNNGTVNLLSVTVTDDKGTASTADDITYAPFNLAVSESKYFSGQYTAANPSAATQSDTVRAFATNQVVGFPGATATPVTAVCKGVTATPALTLTKKCVAVRVPDGVYEVVKVITSGTVKNTGDIELVNVVVNDDDGTKWTYPYLAIGQTEVFTKTEVSTTPMAPNYTDTVTATGTAILGFGKATATPVSAVCTGIVTNPSLVLEKGCIVVAEPAANNQSRVKVNYFGKVRNNGDVTLLNVYVTDNLGTNDTSDDVRFGPYTLYTGVTISFSGSYYPSNPTAEYFQDTVRASADNIVRGFPGATAIPVTARCVGIKTNPTLALYKECSVVVVNDTPDHKKLWVTYRGYVKNTGDVTLLNVYVTDDLGTANTGDDVTYGPFSLHPGAEASFEGKYLPTIATAATFSDTVTASGVNSLIGFPAPANVKTTATCAGIKTHPELQLEKHCDAQLVYLEGGRRVVLITYHGVVRNTGDVRLVNVFVTDDRGTPSYTADDQSYGPFTLSPGESQEFNNSYIASNPTSHTFNDTVVAYGMSELKGFPGASATPVTATCAGVIVNPYLAVSQQCVTALEEIGGRKRVAVTVTGSVTNAGDIELEHVLITTETGAIIQVGSLVIGQTYTFTRTVYPSNPTSDVFSFSFVATADAILGFGSVTSTSANAQCEGFPVNPRLTLVKECHVGLVDKLTTQKVVVYYSGTVTNTGDIELINVYVTDNKGTTGNPADDVRYGPFSLKPGVSQNFSGQYYPSSPTDITFSDTVTATGDNIILGYPSTTAVPVTATCKTIKLRASLALEKECGSVLKVDTSGTRKVVVIQFSGTVANDGEVTLTNVLVYDDFKGTADTSDDKVFGPFILKPGESMKFSGEYSPADPTASYFFDTVRATASNIIEGFPGVTATPVDAKCKGFVFNPKIQLTKQCDVVIDQVETKQYGCVAALQVHYHGTVTNAGDIGLVNVIVRDDKGTTILSDDEFFGPFNLPVGDSKNFAGSYYPCVSGVPRDIQLSDTVTATGTNEVIGFGGPEPKSATATCAVCY